MYVGNVYWHGKSSRASCDRSMLRSWVARDRLARSGSTEPRRRQARRAQQMACSRRKGNVVHLMADYALLLRPVLESIARSKFNATSIWMSQPLAIPPSSSALLYDQPSLFSIACEVESNCSRLHQSQLQSLFPRRSRSPVVKRDYQIRAIAASKSSKLRRGDCADLAVLVGHRTAGSSPGGTPGLTWHIGPPFQVSLGVSLAGEK